MPTIGTYQGQDIQAGTDAQVAQQVAKINTQSTQPQPVTPVSTTPVTNTVPVSTLTSTPPTPATVTQPQPATGTAGLNGAIIARQDAFIQGLAQDAAQKQANYQQYKDPLYQALLGQTTLGQATNEAYAQTVDPAQKALLDINNQITAEQVSARHQVEALQNNPQGLYGQGLQDKIDQINRQSTSKQADLAVIQLAKQGQYDSAKAIADRAVAAQMEQQKNKLDALQFMYQDNKDLFTKAEQRQFETAQADRNRQLELQTYKEKTRYDQIIKQSDPLYQANLAKARADAVAQQLALSPAGKDTETAKTVNTINGILNGDPKLVAQKLGNTFGPLAFASRNIPGTEGYATKAEINKIVGQLALAARGQLKGQGQISDFEGRLLQNAQTSLRLGMSPAQAEQELKNIRGAILTSSGEQAYVKITAPDGTTKYGNADQNTITSATRQGYSVEYQ